MRYELEFANLCGIPTSTEKTFCKKNISLATFANKNRHRSKSWSLFINNKFENNLENFIMPENWECNIKPLTEIMVLNNQPRIFFNNNPDGIVQDYLYRYRFIIFLSSISEIPLEYQIYNNYFLKFTFLDQTIQYKLNFENGEETTKGFSLFVNKLKTFYFYTSGKEQIKSFLKKKEVIYYKILSI